MGVFSAIGRFFSDMKADFRNYDKKNADSAAVFSARFFSSYRGVFVQKLTIGYNAASFGIIFLGSKIKSERILLHEYGHYLQLKEMGFFRFLRQVAFPSVTANLLDRMKKLPLPYYGSPWERGADIMGNAAEPTALWHEGAPDRFTKLFPLLFRRKAKVYQRFGVPMPTVTVKPVKPGKKSGRK